MKREQTSLVLVLWLINALFSVMLSLTASWYSSEVLFKFSWRRDWSASTSQMFEICAGLTDSSANGSRWYSEDSFKSSWYTLKADEEHSNQTN